MPAHVVNPFQFASRSVDLFFPCIFSIRSSTHSAMYSINCPSTQVQTHDIHNMPVMHRSNLHLSHMVHHTDTTKCMLLHQGPPCSITPCNIHLPTKVVNSNGVPGKSRKWPRLMARHSQAIAHKLTHFSKRIFQNTYLLISFSFYLPLNGNRQ